MIMRGLFLLDHVLGDLRYSIRSIRKDVRFTFVAVFALAVGIGASTVVFSVFYNLMFNAVAARDAQRLVVPVMQNAEAPRIQQSAVDQLGRREIPERTQSRLRKSRRRAQRYCAGSVWNTELSI